MQDCLLLQVLVRSQEVARHEIDRILNRDFEKYLAQLSFFTRLDSSRSSGVAKAL